MTNSKLIIYLKTLSNAEMKDFGLFLSISKVAKDAQALFQYVKKYHPNYAAKALDKTKIAQKLFSKYANKEKKLSNATQRCSILLNDFFVQEELKADKVNKDFLLLQALKNRKLDTYFFRKAEQIEKEWEQNQPAGLKHLHNVYSLKEMCFNHPKYSIKKRQPVNILSIIKNIDDYYFAIKFYWHLLLQNNSSYFSEIKEKKEEEKLLNTMQDICKTDTYAQAPQIYFLAKLLESFRSNDFDNYDNLKDSFVDILSLYSQKEKYMIILFLYAACYRNYQLGKPKSTTQLFELNCLLVENNLIIDDGYIRSDQFWNIVTIGLLVKQLIWTENFIDQFSTYLPSNEKDDILSVCKAMLSFHKKEFNEALFELSTIKFQNVHYALQAKNIQLKCYYELDDDYSDLFWDCTKSFYMFLFRNKSISEQVREDFKNFITICKELYKIKNLKTPNELISIKEKFTSNTKVASKTWLMEKIEEKSEAFEASDY